ncbi:hypothetical protein SAY86_031501 [Trapa natans]|uniref:Uncharacterized protein n=1 Tax=Trapa natans TaxID=22666 RepID=A0AAN7R9S3_TRANT|nr:hypothetical protein SAY86_031501 [Trapa natans]
MADQTKHTRNISFSNFPNPRNAVRLCVGTWEISELQSSALLHLLQASVLTFQFCLEGCTGTLCLQQKAEIPRPSLYQVLPRSLIPVLFFKIIVLRFWQTLRFQVGFVQLLEPLQPLRYCMPCLNSLPKIIGSQLYDLSFFYCMQKFRYGP